MFAGWSAGRIRRPQATTTAHRRRPSLVTFQNTQNRDTAAVHIKLDELIRAMEGAHNALLDLEELDEKELARFRKRYEALANEARLALRNGKRDTGSPFVDDKH
ncbi:low affinity iron permease family protein [Pandoraea pnomenusa]|nr:low affinity iron permease family protein [Pandoraea pnomenusa]